MAITPGIGPIGRAACCALFLWLLAASAQAQRLAPVEIVAAAQRDIVETLNLTGTLRSPNTAQLAPDVEGRIMTIEVDAGDRVSAGEVLLVLDEELTQLALQQAIAAEQEAETDLADAQRRRKEVTELVARRSFPESEARGLAARVERNRAILARRQAERALAAATLKRHTLRAPFDGVIASREVDLGERADTDSPAFRLVAVDRLQLDLQVPQGYFHKVRRDTPLGVSVDALPGESFSAAVASIVPVADPNARTFLVRAYLDNSAMRMTPGMSARASLRIGAGRKGVVVPRDALIRYPDGRTIVWVVDGDDRQVQERLVRTGLGFDGNVEIVEGLSAGESVVLRGNESLRQGQTVQIVGERDAQAAK